MNAKEQLDKAIEQAKNNNITVTEVWIPEKEYREVRAEFKPEKDYQTYNGLRVRKSKEELIRVGQTTCPFGPGKT